MHYFQFNIGDYASHTRHLSLLEDLAYRRMLDTYYLNEQHLPLKAEDVARLIGMRDHISEIQQVLLEFFDEVDGGWAHKRADAEIAHFRDKREKASNAGKASAQRRSNVRSTDVQPTNNHKPITNNQEPIIHSNECMSETPVTDDDGDKLNPNHVVEFWNETAVQLGKPKVRDLTPERRQLLKSRMSQYSIDDFVAVFENIKTSPFLRGDGGWRGCTFDWVFKKANFQKILEGNYNG